MTTAHPAIKVPLKKKIDILVIDDDEDDFTITASHIEKANAFICNISFCSNYESALEEICKAVYDIYFVDFRLGPRTGLDLIREAIDNGCQEPIVLLTGVGTKEIDVQAMEAGAVDYLVKSEMTPEKLERCIRYALSRHEFIKALKFNEQKFRNIFERSKDSVFMADNDAHFQDVNATMCKMFGFTKEELLNMSLYDLVPEENEKLQISNLLDKNKEVSDREIILSRKEKEKIDCVLSMAIEKDSEGKTYIQGIIHDITSLKNAEKATLQVEKSKVAERLIRTLAHEVRNPLNNINLSIEQLSSELADNENLNFLEIIKRNSNRINNIISKLLQSSKPAHIIREKVFLKSILESALSHAADRLTLKNARLIKNYTSENAWILGDMEKLQIAFLNIIINAIEAIQEDSGVLEIHLFSEDGKFLVHIQDNGIGISGEGMSRIFEPYYTTKSDGMGLGLAATMNIIQSHNGLINVRSNPGKGTLFIISFKDQEE